jgi:hypothetical protein
MEMDIKSFIKDVAIKNGWNGSDLCLKEILRYSKTLKEYGRDSHRWYDLFHRVVKVEDVFIDFIDIHNSGEEPAFDREEENKIILDSAKQVFPKEVTVIDYVEQQ